jgi:predicted nucleic acid-binding protein
VIVLDASVLTFAVGERRENGDKARALLGATDTTAVPDIVDLETLSALRKLWRIGKIDGQMFRVAIDDLVVLPLVRHPSAPLVRRVHQLRDNLTPYDACYVALAENLDCPLVTADRRLANAPGTQCEIKLFP